jgi:hypothetical protein
MLPQVIVKPTMTERASTTTTTIDPDLQFEGEAGATYLVEFNLIPAAIQDADFRTTWIVPSGASGLKNVLGPASNATTNSNADNITMRAGVHGFGTNVAYAGVRDGNTVAFTVQEFAVVTLTDAGTVGIAWAQNTSNATGSRLYNGSWMRVTRLA